MEKVSGHPGIAQVSPEYKSEDIRDACHPRPHPIWQSSLPAPGGHLLATTGTALETHLWQGLPVSD